MTPRSLLRSSPGCIYTAPRQASRFLTRAEPLGSIYIAPIQALVQITETNPAICIAVGSAGPGSVDQVVVVKRRAGEDLDDVGIGSSRVSTINPGLHRGHIGSGSLPCRAAAGAR